MQYSRLSVSPLPLKEKKKEVHLSSQLNNFPDKISFPFHFSFPNFVRIKKMSRWIVDHQFVNESTTSWEWRMDRVIRSLAETRTKEERNREEATLLVAGSLRNGQFSRRERSIHRSKETLNSTSCLVHSLITHARSRLGHPWLNWLPESGRVKREHVEGRRKLAEGTVNRRREFFESRSKARSHPRASRVEPSRAGWPVNGRGKKEGHDSCDRNFFGQQDRDDSLENTL